MRKNATGMIKGRSADIRRLSLTERESVLVRRT
jgi:hypothetical protein